MKNKQNWPVLNFAEMQDTIETLHQWIQIVGKIRLRTMPWQNHSWHTALYVTPSGYSTHGIPYQGQIFQIDFDFKKHKLLIQCSNAETITIDLKPKTVANFYKELFEKLSGLGIEIKIHSKPNEIDPAIPFSENTVNKSYDPIAANALWQAMLKANGVFNEFRSDFIGKASPVHLFWGAFDLAVTRFSGNAAPLHQGGMPNMSLEVMQEAYSQEVSSAGFWPGSKDAPMPVFYAYAYPSGASFGEQKVLPKEAFYSPEMGEFFLKYEDVQNSENPEKTLHDFLRTTYEAATNISEWDRPKLEKK
ncbi:hypothetical protein CW736_02115 [Nonlabens sp. MB-3u-79]|uniref:DUF5996 family protein n=1 Tax=Nonlabens sp. MB-3u-79 TaxID=2058134 RepID=UPI000C300332|nr:DUF5996 family protein [Nonlabens sp. MB-3u-79]AUC78269.1 hypothetical protein CW736_02115 [Nonlabens sp. MB-3u-79]